MKLKKQILILLLLLTLFIQNNDVSAAIVVSQNTDTLIVNSDLNSTLEFYDSHQVFVSTVDLMFNATVTSVNVTIPISLAIPGGYYRIAFTNESISQKSFQVITAWLDDNQNAVGNNNPSTKFDNDVVNGSNDDVDTGVQIGIIDKDDDDLDGEYFLIGSSITVLLIDRRRRRFRK